MTRQTVTDGVPWESIVGYCRAVRVGNQIEVSGTTAIENNQVVAPGDLYGQTRFVLEKIERALLELGASRKHIVRTRMFVTAIDQWQLAGKAHGEFFDSSKPTTSMLEVSRLIQPDLLIEIEATAILD